ncbi:MAG: LON peptidase substrate-binding domain-containing protein [Bacilli bacterium]|nr:LON peptidase substrate-binding domain-containing protein [Bacilli bacterium]
MKENLPVLLLRKLVLLPYQEARVELNIDLSKKIMDLSEKFYNNKLLVICPLNTLESSPTESDLPEVGTLTKIKSKIILPNGNYRVVLTGLNRVKVHEYRNHSIEPEILESTVKRIYIDDSDAAEETAILRTLKAVLDKYMLINPAASNSVTNTIANMTDLDMLTDVVTNYLPFDIHKKVQYMNEFDYLVRANNLIKDINVELEVINIESKIEDEIRETFDREQRELIIKQKISKLNEELGLGADKQTEVSLYNEKVSALNIDKKIKDKLFDEIKKYSYTSETNPDSSVTRNYLETIISLPWKKYSKD